ncbi:glycosyltransferase family 4 protein [Haloarcula sp. JP-L23]|uniref:glycosyltransferase family 4 protein n=1 Tax=Haloarcula sp. JP-L23 TaxID=2716717 RepID=UPI00140F344B|nr:glycosyltransferase family 4 protein [Haloarcula sp. JP-L23]
MNVAVVCFGFEPSNLRKQPWRYVHELVTNLPEDGLELTVITDVDRSETAGIEIRTVEKILGATGPTSEVLTAIQREDPDVVVSLIGSTNFVRPSTIASATDKPTVGIFAGPLYSLSEILNVGLGELYRNHPYLAVHLAGSLAPDWAIRTRSAAFTHIVTLTAENKTRLRSAGVDTPISAIPPGIDEFDLKRPARPDIDAVREELNPEGVPMILYFTSPLTLRGTDTLVKAFARVRRTRPCKLVVLSRQDGGGLTRDEKYIQRLAIERSVGNSLDLVPRNLSPEGVKTYLTAADIVALPFKIVQASVPISILEAMSMGKPVVSTKTAGIPELLDDERQLVEPADLSSLTQALYSLVSRDDLRERIGVRNRDRMQGYQRWDEARVQFQGLLEEYA